MKVDGRTVVHKGNTYATAARNSMGSEELESLYSMAVKEFDDWDKDYVSRKVAIKMAPEFFTPTIFRKYEKAGALKKMYLGKSSVIYFLEDVKNVLRDIIVGRNKMLKNSTESSAIEESADV
jgi:hypothetical protein